MKLPSIFVPEKNLENKICELIKEPENIKEYYYSELDSRIVYNKAKEVTEKLGKLDQISSAYTFEDKKTGMIIEYFPWYQDQTAHLRIYEYNKHNSSFFIVFKADKGSKLSAYHLKEILHIPGDKWQDRLEEVYKRTKPK